MTQISEKARTLLRRRHIGFVYQFFNLIPTLSVFDNVALPLELNGHSIATGGDRVDGILQQVGLAGRGKQFPDRLSGGEQQRVAIARALVHQPALVLADELTGNLDARSGRQVLDLLNELSGESGQTVLIVTHSREVADTADRVLALENGRIAETADGIAW
jgi:putative ABC transport system ATP-binding protein